ncbi:MAG TPA: hypothetical protein VMV52_00130 [Candidatus Nanopelagicaceae bacterium]|nr:hypothetical protein [Candidatus Nanopelagicaceae bacterium]
MSKRIKFGVIIISTCGLLVATGVWVNATHRSAQLNDLPAWVALPAKAQSSAGVRLQAHDALKHPMATHITTQQAFNVATERIGKAQAKQAVVHVTFGDFFDDRYIATSPKGFPKDVARGVPAYVITFDGIIVPLIGLSGGSNSEMNVVVNAATGQVIEEFSFH